MEILCRIIRTTEYKVKLNKKFHLYCIMINFPENLLPQHYSRGQLFSLPREKGSVTNAKYP